jgi:hypothetical protein
VGNDTDGFRRRRTRRMPCVVRCPLEENTWRMLRDQLGPVEDATREEGTPEKERMGSAELAVGEEEAILQGQHGD